MFLNLKKKHNATLQIKQTLLYWHFKSWQISFHIVQFNKLKLSQYLKQNRAQKACAESTQRELISAQKPSQKYNKDPSHLQ